MIECSVRVLTGSASEDSEVAESGLPLLPEIIRNDFLEIILAAMVVEDFLRHLCSADSPP